MFVLLQQVAKHADYRTYQKIRATCKNLNKVLAPFKVCRFQEYRSLLQLKELEVQQFGDHRLPEYDEEDLDEEGLCSDDAFWGQANDKADSVERLDFQKKVRLELSSLTQDQYFYVCSNYLAREALRIVDLALKKSDTFKHIDFTTGTKAGIYFQGTIFAYGFCIASNDLDIFKRLLLSLPRPVSSLLDLFIFACRSGSIDIAEFLMTEFEIDPSCQRNQAFKSAAIHGRLDIVQRLLADSRVDPSCNDNVAFIYAAYRGHLEMVRVMLLDPRIIPSARHNFAIVRAAEFGYLEMVQLLMSHPRVDPSADDNAAIQAASRNGYLEVVRYLLNDPRVDPSARNNAALNWACYDGEEDVVRILLSDSRIDPSAANSTALENASARGKVEIVRLLLADPRVDPSAGENVAILVASANGHLEIVKLLLADSRVDPSANDNVAIQCAAKNGQLDVFHLLLSDPRVQKMIAINFAARSDDTILKSSWINPNKWYQYHRVNLPL